MRTVSNSRSRELPVSRTKLPVKVQTPSRSHHYSQSAMKRKIRGASVAKWPRHPMHLNPPVAQCLDPFNNRKTKGGVLAQANEEVTAPPLIVRTSSRQVQSPLLT